MNKQIVATKKAPAAVGPYSQGVKVQPGTLWFFSGQIAIDPATGKVIEGDAVAQTAQILKNIAALLADQGLTADNVVKTTVFLTDINVFKSVNEVYADFFGAALPARSCMAVAALPLGVQVEIEIIAAA